MIIIDFFVGIVFGYLVNHAKGGDNSRNNYICNETKDEILILGSSRAIHHYIPTIIQDSLNLSCYNCGQDGNGILLNYSRYQMIKNRYEPNLIIYDITPDFDYLSGDDNHKYLGWQKAYYDRQGISNVFEAVDPLEKYKMQSNMYRYNSTCIQIIGDFIHPLQSHGIQGYRPLYGDIKREEMVKKEKTKAVVIDSIKMHYLEKFIDEIEKEQLVIVISPIWNGMNKNEYKPIEDLCQKKDIHFLNYANNPKYVHQDKYFKDAVHLNNTGAELFTQDIINQIKDNNIKYRLKNLN